MKSLGRFFIDWKETFYGPSLYASIPSERSLGGAVGFLFLVSFITVIAGGGATFLDIGSALAKFAQSNAIEEMYPADLVVTIKDGVATTNVKEPYLIPLKENLQNVPPYENLLAIDTRADATLSELGSYKAFATLAHDHLIVAGKASEQRIMSLASVKDFTLDKAFVLEASAPFMKFFSVAAIPLVMLLLMILALMTFVYHLLASLIGALLVIVAGKIRKTPLGYGAAYKIALFASAPIMTLATALSFAHIALPGLASVCLFVVVVLINLQPVQPASPATP
jgi:hypothetical protein